MLRAALMAALVMTAHAQESGSPANERQRPEPEALVLWNRPIVTLRATVGGNPPSQRVENARRRFNALTDRERAGPVVVQTAQFAGVNGRILTVGGQPVFGLAPADLDPESALTLDRLADQAAARLHAVLAAQAEQRRVPVLMRGVGLTLLTALVFVAAIRLILAGREWAVRKIDMLLRRRQLAVAGIDIVPTLATVERATMRVLSWAMIIPIAYLCLTFVLSLFPYTAPVGQRLGAHLASAAADASSAIAKGLPSIILVIGVLLITRAISLWASRLFSEIEHGARTVKWLAPEQARATRRIAVGAIWALGIVIAYPLLPWSRNLVFQGMSVVLGLAVSLASTGLINQWISGLVILYSRSFRVGDFVIVDDAEGFVTEIGVLATKLRTMRREEITVPNAVLTADRVTNLTRLGVESGALLSVSIAIGYDVPWKHVNALLLQAAAATKGVRRDPSPRVLEWELCDFYVRYQLHVYLQDPTNRVTVRSDLNSRILDAFAAAGVQIMAPHFESQPPKPVVAPAATTP